MEIYAVKLNGFTNPVGYLFDTLLVSWKVRGAKGKKQAEASIQVALDDAFRDIVYEIGGAELDSLSTPLEMQLSPRTRYYFRVCVTSDAGETAQSETCFFETAKRDEPWAAKWIGVDVPEQVGALAQPNAPGGADAAAGMAASTAFHPAFRKFFAAANAKEVASARLYITGLGLFEAYLNGEKAGDDLLAPFINDYQEHVQYCTYDVTGLLQAQNELLVLLGKGWYMGRFGLSGAAHTDRGFALITELAIRYVDGSEEVICSDESWEWRASVFELTDIYDGETQNHLRFENRENPWSKAVPVNAPAKLAERYSPPLRAMEALPVKEVLHTPAGETVLDFGQNFAGYVECSQPVPKGVTMTFEFGEILQNGNFYHDNYRSAKSAFTYVSDGEARVIRPHFTFFGFRYVKVTGLNEVDAACFTGRAVYSEMERTGAFETGNPKINQLHENTLWGLKSNFLDMPTDCPQRDERLGWTGDAQVFCPTAGYLMDTRGFYAKFMRDLRSDQLRNSGKTAVFLPNEFSGLAAAVWSDIATFLPDMFYTYYGSREMLAAHYPMMKDWVDSVRREDQKRGEKHLWDFGFQFGDWLALDGATEQSTFGRTDNGYIASAYYYASAGLVAKASRVLGYEDATEYEGLAEKIHTAILNEYITPSGRLAVDTQTGYLVALRFGLYKDKEKITGALRERITKDCRRIKGGFVGATMMNTVLAENGMADLAYDFLFFEGFPGWLYAINLGATTIWERWNSVLPDGSISGTGMNSLNHYAYGSVVEFLYRHAAGIQPLEPGFRKVRISPMPEARLQKLHCAYDSAVGRFVSDWQIEEDGSLRFHIEIPFGAQAELALPEQDVVVLEAGTYTFHLHTKWDYHQLYNAETPLERLLEDPRAVTVLDAHLPAINATIDRNDVEAMTKSLSDMRRRALLFRTPAEGYDKAIEAIQQIHGVYCQN